MESSHKKQPEIPQHIRLLEIAHRAPLFLSPNRQPFVICPATATAVPLYSETFYGWFISAVEKKLGTIPSSQQVGQVIRNLNNQAHAARNQEAVHTRSAKIAPKTYQLDLGLDDNSTVEITGRNWSVSQFPDAYFERLETSDPLPIPEPTLAPLHTYLEKMYGISLDDAHKLSHWMAQAMLPDQKPPILLITGEAREEAVTQLKTLVDPSSHALIDLPVNRKDVAQQAIENGVLAYTTDEQLPETKILVLDAVRRGMPARLKQVSKGGPKRFTAIHRPIIIASLQTQKIGNHQLTIEINSTRQVEHNEIMGPLLDVVVQIVGQATVRKEPLTMRVPGTLQPNEIEPQIPPQQLSS